MTHSHDDGAREALPPALPSMWRLCKLGYQHEPALIVTAFSLAVLSALPDALLALWFKVLGQGVLQSDWTRVRVAVLALGMSATATWFLQTVSTRVTRRFRDKVTIALEAHVAALLASIPTIAHQERPEYLDRLSVLRNQVFMLDHMYMSLFSTCGWILRLGVTIAFLMSIHPALGLLALFALPPGATSTWRPAVERSAYERGAASGRLARHLFDMATTAAPGKERCASQVLPIVSWSNGGRRGSAATPRSRPRAGRRRAGIRSRGQCLAARMWVRSSLSHRASRPRPATCCWRWQRARGCRRTWALRSAKSDFCACGWIPRGVLLGSRITRAELPQQRTSPRRRASLRVSASITSHLSTQAPIVRSLTMSASNCLPAR